MRCSITSRAASAKADRAASAFRSRPVTHGLRGSRKARALALLLPLILGAPAARADDITLKAPRAFGYVIGDTLTLEANIHLDPGGRLDPASLPQPHKVSSWLDLVAVDIEPAIGSEPAGPYRLRMTYQTFFSALEPRSLEIPPWPLTVRHGDAARTLSVPAFHFVVSPLRELVSSQGGNPLALQPDILPSPYPLRPDVEKASLAAAMAALGAAGFALAQGWRPFARRSRPLAAAARQIRRQRADSSQQGYLAALLALHRAFDTIAGHRLLKDDIDTFLESAPALAEEKADIEQLFEASRAAFFGSGPAAAMARLPHSELVALAARLARAERRMARAAPAKREGAAS